MIVYFYLFRCKSRWFSSGKDIRAVGILRSLPSKSTVAIFLPPIVEVCYNFEYTREPRGCNPDSERTNLGGLHAQYQTSRSDSVERPVLS